jgi:hypothetical protein
MDIQTEIHIVVYREICECFYSYSKENITYDPIASSKHTNIMVDMWNMLSYNVWSPITETMGEYEYRK